MKLQGSGEGMPAELKPVYTSWLERHMRNGKGDAKLRLANHGHAEQMFLARVWWPAFGKLEALYPEYEVRDFKDGWRYLDFAYLSQGMKVCIEIDGYGPHWRDVDRWKFADNLMRQNHLVIDGWLVLRFSYDDIVEKPRRCQQVLQQLLGKRSIIGFEAMPALTPIESAIARMAFGSRESIKPEHVASSFGIYRKTAAKHLKSLVAKGYLLPAKPSVKRVYSYVANPAVGDYWLL
ncbi:DNA-binding response regulator [Cohnella thermotolerans]|uniref:DNA-binding response regulator n=1 Tax=Cohnella thermotolerans TaxID=329858 RepID=UPI0004088BBD|nr:DNA-binding response regulator [Cohnella thermotolerans]